MVCLIFMTEVFIAELRCFDNLTLNILLCYNAFVARETAAVVSDTYRKGGVDVEEIISFTLLVMIIVLYIKK